MDQREIPPAEMKVVNEATPLSYNQLENSLHSIDSTNESTEPAVAASVAKRYVTLGNVPVRLTCKNCRSLITTQIEYLPSERSNCTTFACLCYIFCWPCALIPCLIDSSRDVHHTCPVCGNLIGFASPC